MSKVKTALVIGGGVAGPVAGMALRRAGVEATVYEAYPTTADGVGGSLGLAPNGLSALGIVGVADTVRAVAWPMARGYAFGRRGFYLFRPHPDGGTEWGANLPQDTPMTLAEARRIPNDEWLRRLLEYHAEDHPGAELIRHTDPDRFQVLGSLHMMPRVPRWHSDRMVLVGDAVHAPSNSSGQGASLAIESAVQLARCVRDLPDAPSAFGAYERLRRPRVERVAARAARINSSKAAGPLSRALMPLLMPIMLKTVMHPERAFGVEQRYVIDWDEPVTNGTAGPRPA